MPDITRQPYLSDDWGEIPEPSRSPWARALLAYPPSWPGHFIAAVAIAPPIVEGRAIAPRTWVDLARELHGVGFTPNDYLLLCQDLHIRILEGTLDPGEHGHLFTKLGRTSLPYWELVPFAAAWAQWPTHLAAGRSPSRATSYILTHGQPGPLASTSLEGGPSTMLFD